MDLNKLVSNLRGRLNSHWIACRIISDKKSILYGIRFSYPLYIFSVVLGVLSENLYLLSLTAFIAFLGIKLPMHPFDYVYNFVAAKLKVTSKIPGRGSELQVNSIVSLLFTLCAIALIVFEIDINYSLLAIIYTSSSIFFLCIFLLKTDAKLKNSK